MHGQHVTWQTTFSRANPEYTVVDRAGETRQWGVLCYGYPEVREHVRRRIRRTSGLRVGRRVPVLAHPGPTGGLRRPVRLQRTGVRGHARALWGGHPP